MTESETVAGGILLRAANLVEPKGAWTQKTFARDSAGDACSSYAEEATSYCAIGALNKASVGAVGEGIYKAVAHFEEYVGTPIAIWNDHPKRTQKEVVAFLRGAAKKLEEKKDED